MLQPKDIIFTVAPKFVNLFYQYKVKTINFHKKFTELDISANRKNDYFFLYDFAILEIDTEDNL